MSAARNIKSLQLLQRNRATLNITHITNDITTVQSWATAISQDSNPLQNTA